MGYHINKIKKGELGYFSKIKEEYKELKDAYEQDNDVLQICELADLIGAIEAYSVKNYNISLDMLIKMMNCTKQAFIDKERT